MQNRDSLLRFYSLSFGCPNHQPQSVLGQVLNQIVCELPAEHPLAESRPLHKLLGHTLFRQMYINSQKRLFTKTVHPICAKISVTFVDKDGEEKHIKVPIGMSMLEAAHENDIELEGACEGSLACSTCHVIVMNMQYYNKLEDPTDEENDMLDLAFGLTDTSRLGCQVIATPELDGIRLAIPAATRNFAVDGILRCVSQPSRATALANIVKP
ncbi:hypothetical protein CDL15_Pgr004522 [Punica granatum]|uniref:2Fe-2S ferredoxin-type domain-containing protein n=1 Tax=Punica granatum TaxID=22663 RepID=A0A218WPL8_PUNGR|nr:hypothetical protein CDL15_Pgr004522 [Punica granatum]